MLLYRAGSPRIPVCLPARSNQTNREVLDASKTRTPVSETANAARAPVGGAPETDLFRHRRRLARERQAGRVERLGHQRAGAREDQKPRRVLRVGKRVEQPRAVRRIERSQRKRRAWGRQRLHRESAGRRARRRDTRARARRLWYRGWSPSVGVPPAAATRESPLPLAGVNRITSPRPQDPAKDVFVSLSEMAGPPDASIFLSLPPAENAMKRLSGDQNGPPAPSVPARGWAARSASARTHNTTRPFASGATKAMRRPSGESARRSFARRPTSALAGATNVLR